MSRRRYVSTDISLDEAVDAVAQQSDFAALLYTWMLPHVKDDATITGSAKRLLAEVLPHRRDKTVADIEAALEIIEGAGLFVWDRENDCILFDCDAFYRYQSYIKAENRRESAENATSLTPSLPPSLTPPHSGRGDVEFGAFYDTYPKKGGKDKARIAFDAAITRGFTANVLSAAARLYGQSVASIEKRYVKSCTNWLDDEVYKDFLPKKRKPPCPTCGDKGVIYHDDGGWDWCSACKGVAS
jgi:hypothetical protein